MKTKLTMLVLAAGLLLTACNSRNTETNHTEPLQSAETITSDHAVIDEESTAGTETVTETAKEIQKNTDGETESNESLSEPDSSAEDITQEYDSATAAAGTTAPLDLETAFELAGITVEKEDQGYTLTYPAGSLSEAAIEELKESYEDKDIVISNEDGTTTFRLTDDEFSYMAEAFHENRNPASE